MSREHFDIGIIGGGVIGLAVGYRLAGAGRSVCVIDHGAKMPPATHAAAGMLAPSFEKSVSGNALFELSQRSLALWSDFSAQLQSETGIDIDHQSQGILGVAMTPAQADDFAKEADALIARGSNVAFISGDAAREREPALSRDVLAGLWAPDDGQVDPLKLTAALRKALEHRGAGIVAGAVSDARHDGNGWQLEIQDAEPITVGGIVIATGAAKRWPAPQVHVPPLHPVKGEALALVQDVDQPLGHVIRGAGAYLCPKSDGRLVIGATEAAHIYDLQIDDKRVDDLREGAGVIAPRLNAWTELSRWAGLRPATPDGAPILGRDHRGPPGSYLALGHYRNGILLAPASAALLGDEILGEAASAPPAAFRPERFG